MINKVYCLLSIFFFTILSLLLVFCSSGSCARKNIAVDAATLRFREQLDSLVLSPTYKKYDLGIAIQSVKTKEMLYTYNEDKSLIPASNLKLFTSVAALQALTPYYRYKTVIKTNGVIQEGVLKGDILIDASGDPTLTARFHGGNPSSVFIDWATEFKKLGINRVTGDLIIDNSNFKDNILGIGWSEADRAATFSATSDAFSFNENCIRVVANGTVPGRKATIHFDPICEGVQLVNETTTIRSGSGRSCTVRYSKDKKKLIVHGKVPIHGNCYYTVAADQPAFYAASCMRSILREQGITIYGKTHCTNVDPDSKERYSKKGSEHILFTHYSPELREIVHEMNKESNNFYANQLFLTMGKELRGNSMLSESVVKHTLYQLGINTKGLHMTDGSGLSQYDRTTAGLLTNLLFEVSGKSVFPYFYDSLPVAGIDGTLHHRMKREPMCGNVRAKTGAIASVRSLAGYVRTQDGEIIAFSVIGNGVNSRRYDMGSLQDRICLLLAQYHR